MMSTITTQLTADGCRARQQRLRQHLADQGLDAALLTNPAHVFYFANDFHSQKTESCLLIPAHGPVALSTSSEADGHLVADKVETYKFDRLCTLRDDQPSAVLEPIAAALSDYKRIGCDEPARPWRLANLDVVDLNDTLYRMRRSKDADELAVIRTAIIGCDAAYDAARGLLAPARPVVTELQVHARMHAAAIEAVGEPIGEFGNDFQSGTPGGPPRQRKVEIGELMILDIGVVLRAYFSDLCRTFAVGNRPSDAQREAARLVVEVLDHVEQTVRPGVSCKAIYEQVHARLDGQHGWIFPHHLGHGIGLSTHEAPRLNPNWDDVFEIGDVFTAEPGLYGDELRGGVRIENDYLVTDEGVKCLSDYPTEL